MNNSSNLLVLGATGQVGRLVAKTLKRRWEKGSDLHKGDHKRAEIPPIPDL